MNLTNHAPSSSCSGLACSGFNVTGGLLMAPVQSRYEYPENVTFSCENASLALIGRSLRRCMHTGSWDSQLPVCKGKRIQFTFTVLAEGSVYTGAFPRSVDSGYIYCIGTGFTLYRGIPSLCGFRVHVLYWYQF